MSKNVLLLSIHAKYAEMIFQGSKQVELRKVRPKHLNKGDIILVYATLPRQALVGMFVVEIILEMTPDKLWKKVKSKAGVSRIEFRKYFKNVDVGYAIYIRRTFGFEPPVEIRTLKEKWGSFHPPQSYKYLNKSEIDSIQRIVKIGFYDVDTNVIELAP